MLYKKIRISEIEIAGFKNTAFGCVKMPSTISKNYFANTADILGIYGQNGSGKTSVVEALLFIKYLLEGKSLPFDAGNYISVETNTCALTAKFIIETAQNSYMIQYTVVLSKDNSKICVQSETLSYNLWENNKFSPKKILIDYNLSSKAELFTPKFRYEEILKKDPENLINLKVAQKIAIKESSSFIFSQDVINILDQNPEFALIIRALNDYAKNNLYVMSKLYLSAISPKMIVPFQYKMNGESGRINIEIAEPTLITKEEYELSCKLINQLNLILSNIIPNMSLAIHDYGEQMLENGSLGQKIELISIRGNIKIPFKYESEGIIKIVSLLNILMCTYNESSMCMVVDELDAGVFEYLLGELLSILERGAKGQLIFTSHNLRALEMLAKESIVFSTINPNNRYIRLQNIKSKNLREAYLRSIVLGGQKEEVYEDTDSDEISRAFRQANLK